MPPSIHLKTGLFINICEAGGAGPGRPQSNQDNTKPRKRREKTGRGGQEKKEEEEEGAEEESGEEDVEMPVKEK
ncbi:hypothetical protein Pmani_033318 [Petrolisthes manimaculis]|uniref:Uncharacterized protein n=1 Tax=Petrolisthes manimaculis TaxID=1843537 RepID=A0AAE1NPZ7_9EUCA|nr:hypothetical protein Pmani_033318 [Petrolisthes manimaculis]